MDTTHELIRIMNGCPQYSAKDLVLALSWVGKGQICLRNVEQ